MRATAAFVLLAGCQQGQLAGLVADVIVPAEVQAAHADDLPLVLVTTFEGEVVSAVPVREVRDLDLVVRLRQQVIALEDCLTYRVRVRLERLDGDAPDAPGGDFDRGRWLVGPIDAYEADLPASTPLDPPVTAFDVTSGWDCTEGVRTGTITVAEEG